MDSEDIQPPPTEEELKEFYGGKIPKPPKPFSHKSYDADVEMPPCRSLSGTRQYMNINETVPEDVFEKMLDQIDTTMALKKDGNIEYYNDTLVAQATLMDLAFRYYYAGGETGKVNDKDFTSAIKACDISLRLVREARKARRDESLDRIKWEDQRRKLRAESRRRRDNFGDFR